MDEQEIQGKVAILPASLVEISFSCMTLSSCSAP